MKVPEEIRSSPSSPTDEIKAFHKLSSLRECTSFPVPFCRENGRGSGSHRNGRFTRRLKTRRTSGEGRELQTDHKDSFGAKRRQSRNLLWVFSTAATVDWRCPCKTHLPARRTQFSNDPLFNELALLYIPLCDPRLRSEFKAQKEICDGTPAAFVSCGAGNLV